MREVMKELWDDVQKIAILVCLVWLSVLSTMIKLTVDERQLWQEKVDRTLEEVKDDCGGNHARIDTSKQRGWDD